MSNTADLLTKKLSTAHGKRPVEPIALLCWTMTCESAEFIAIGSCRLFNSEWKLNLLDQTIKIELSWRWSAMSWENAFFRANAFEAFKVWNLNEAWRVASTKLSLTKLPRSIWQNCFSHSSRCSHRSSSYDSSSSYGSGNSNSSQLERSPSTRDTFERQNGRSG